MDGRGTCATDKSRCLLAYTGLIGEAGIYVEGAHRLSSPACENALATEPIWNAPESGGRGWELRSGLA